MTFMTAAYQQIRTADEGGGGEERGDGVTPGQGGERRIGEQRRERREGGERRGEGSRGGRKGEQRGEKEERLDERGGNDS